MTQIFEISNSALYTVILLAISMFFLFRLLTWLLPLLVLKKEKRKNAWRYTSLLELIVWMSFLIWSVNYLSHNSPMYAIGLFVLLFFFTFYTAWIALKDFVAGAFFKTNNQIKVNEIIKIGEYSGKVVKFKPSTLILETESGEAIYLPYSYFYGKVVVKSHPAQTILSHTFRFEIAKNSKLSQVIQNMYGDILNMPWTSLKKEPQIKALNETLTGQMLELTLFSIEKEYFLEMENLIKSKYSLNQDFST